MSLLKTVSEFVRPVKLSSELRTLSGALVILQWDAPESRMGAVTILDWSPRGVRIRHRLPLRKGQLVNVVTPDWTLSARVVWVAELDHAQQTGLIFDRRRLSVP